MSAAVTAFVDAFDDVHTRFILNVPTSELTSSDRIFFQIEQAHWYYEDFLVDDVDSSLPHFKQLKAFALKMFNFSPLLQPHLGNFNRMWQEFSDYKKTISTYGTILLDEQCTSIALCKAYGGGGGWTLPAGKMNQNEEGVGAAARETYEETGFDLQGLSGASVEYLERAGGDVSGLPWNQLSEDGQISVMDDGKRRTMYICRGVPEDFPFAPVARKEVSDIQWWGLDDLPKKTFNLKMFLKGTHRWIKQQGKGGANKNNSNSSRASSTKKERSNNDNSRSNSSKKERSASTKKDRENVTTFDDNNAGWSEEDMFRTNEMLTGKSMSGYSGNPHEFGGGPDPHAFHVVGGSFMNAVGGNGGG
jgi:mRNA-decapping enzyme subunit 2